MGKIKKNVSGTYDMKPLFFNRYCLKESQLMFHASCSMLVRTAHVPHNFENIFYEVFERVFISSKTLSCIREKQDSEQNACIVILFF
jgi:hypothetical protein